MLKADRQNIHHSKLPEPGTIGRIVGQSAVDARRKCIAVAYPLTDSPNYHYSVGIHTVFVRFLDDRSIRRVSGMRFVPLD